MEIAAKEYRGSSDIKASVDAAYLLLPMGGDGSKLERLRLKPFKGRFTPLSPILVECVAGAGFQAVHDTGALTRQTARDVINSVIRVEMHDQWLQSMESHQSQFASNLVALERKMEMFQNQVTEILVQVAQSQALFSAQLAAIAEAHRKLQETVDNYIRFRGDGRQQN